MEASRPLIAELLKKASTDIGTEISTDTPHILFMPLRRRGPAPRHRGKEQLFQWRRPWPPRAEQARVGCPRRAPHRRAPKERVEHELQVVRLLSAGSSVTVTETVGTFSRQPLGATRSRAVCGNPRSMQIATRWSAMPCDAACGDAGTRSVARERSHAAKKLSRVVTLLGEKQARPM